MPGCEIQQVRDFNGICEVTYRIEPNYHFQTNLYGYNSEAPHRDIQEEINKFYEVAVLATCPTCGDTIKTSFPKGALTKDEIIKGRIIGACPGCQYENPQTLSCFI